MTNSLVLLSGWGFERCVWDAVLPHLSARQVMTFDLLDVEAAHGVEAFVEVLLARAPERAVWVGWSLGGQVALHVAQRAPERVAGLVLLATTPCFTTRVDWSCALDAQVLAAFVTALEKNPRAALQRFAMLVVQGERSPRGVARQLMESMAMDVRMFLPRKQQHSAPSPTTWERVGERAPGTKLSLPNPLPLAREGVTEDVTLRGLHAGLVLLRNQDMRAQLAEIRCPMHWLFATDDALIPVACAQAVSTLLPRARVTVVPSAGHAFFLSQPALLQEAVGELRDVL